MATTAPTLPRSLALRARSTPRVQLRKDRLFWEPSRSLRAAGYRTQALGLASASALNQADELNAAADAFLAAGSTDRPTRRTVASLLANYQASKTASELASRTQGDYARHLKRAAAALGDTPADQLTRRAIQAWHDKLAASSPADARNSLAALRAALTWAVDAEEVAANAALGVKAAGRERRQRIATRPELWAIIRTAERMGLHSVAGAALCATATMQRISDTLTLTRSNVDAGVLYLCQSKTKVDLSFRLHPLVIDCLGKLADEPDAPLFPNERTGAAYDLRAFERAWVRVRDAAAVSMPSLTGADASVREPTLKGELAARDLRRSGMVWTAQAGASVAQICSVSGHTLQSGLDILETYLPRQRLLADQAVARLDMIRTPAIEDLESVALAS